MNYNPKILVSGSLAYDKILDFNGRFSDHIMPEKIHKLSVSFVVERERVNFGGTAGNIAYNLKLLGEEPVILSQVGKDFDYYKKWLVKNKLGLEGIKIIKNKNTAAAHIMTDLDDNQITALHLETMGIERGINPALIKKFEPIKIAIISPGNIKDMIGAARSYKKMKIEYIADPGQQIPALSAGQLKELIVGARALFCNDYEVELIMKTLKHKNIKALKQLIEILVVTYGAEGSVIYSKGKEIKIGIVKPRRVVDPTGAGDAYRAGFIKGLINGWDLKKCGELAAWVAKWPVEYYGTQEHRFKFLSSNS
ncbi:MAG TPA: carbohydrate kinase family protein [Patescibacteria group bacterium]|nr:carbohydrate kinase family protein [Patescibacteria group bacterium]